MDWLTVTQAATTTAAWLRESWAWLLNPAIPAALFGAWWLWWRLPKRQVNLLRMTIRDAKARADVEDNFRKTVGQLLGGAAVLIGAGFAYLQFQQQQQAAHDLLISNQVSKGFEQLGSDKVDVRLGGIYALEGVMNTSEQYHRPVLEALSAFVRDHTKENTSDDAPTTDVQAALTIIGRRRAIKDLILDLTYVHIPKANLYRANLANADLSGADLSGADLVFANLSSTFLVGTNLTHAFLGGADLSGANLNGANLTRANVFHSNLTRAELGRANPHLFDVKLIGPEPLVTDLRGAYGLTQPQLDTTCGEAKLDPPLTIKPCNP